MNLIDEIKQLESSCKKLDLSEEEYQQYSNQITSYLRNYTNSLDKIKSWETNTDPSKEIYDFEIRENGYSMEEVLALYERAVNSTGLQPASGGHLGYIPGGGVPLAGFGDLIAGITNKYSGIYFGNPGAIRMENHLINWTAKEFGFEGDFGGNLTTGGSIANLIAVVSARDAHQIKGRDFEKTVIYGSEQMHHSLNKAIRIAGLGECIYRNIPLEENHHINTNFLEDQIKADVKNGLNPFLIIASAGTTDTGVVDDLEKIGKLSQEHNCWLHVDGAYGGYFYLLDELKPLFKGIEYADSLAIDPHKGLFLPYGTGMILVRKREHMLSSHYYIANYMQDAYKAPEEWSPADLSPELSRNFRGVRMWLPMMVHGTKPFVDGIREKRLLTLHLYKELQKLDFIEVGTQPELTVFAFNFKKQGLSLKETNHLNQTILDGLHEDGRIFISSTNLNGKFVLRSAILSFRTHLKEIEVLLDMFRLQAEKHGLTKTEVSA